MILARRSLLLAAPWLLAEAARAAVAGLRLEAAGEEQVALTGAGVRRALVLPAAGAQLLPPVACGGEMLGVAAFRLEDRGTVLEWAAMAALQDGAVVLLALEPLSWRGAGGARMTTRLMTSGDRRQVALQRDSAVPETPTLWRRESWTDYLAWRAPIGLADAPVRAPLAGTRQAVVAGWRRRAAALVAAGPLAITGAVLADAGLAVGELTLGV